MKTIIVMGNGPSLRGFDFKRLEGHDCIGMNSAYRHFERIGWWPKYMCCLDFAVTESHTKEFRRIIEDESIPIEKFFLRVKISNNSRLEVVDLQGNVSTGSHSIRILAKKGYGRFLLIGIDLNYVEKVGGSQAIGKIRRKMSETPEENPNYFFDDYQQKDDVFHQPYCKKVHHKAWQDLHRDADKLGIEIINCNQESQLKIFESSTLEKELGV